MISEIKFFVYLRVASFSFEDSLAMINLYKLLKPDDIDIFYFDI